MSFSQITETKIPGLAPGFGHAVAFDADRLLIGSVWGDYSNPAFFFRRDGDGWTLSQTVQGRGYSRFGAAVALRGNIALVGDAPRDHRGAFYTYLHDGTSWQQISLITGEAGLFATSVCMDDKFALIGSPNESVNGSSSSGAVIAYTTTGSRWIAQDTLFDDDAASGDDVGVSVSFDGDLAIVGDHLSNAAGTNSGSVYFFERSGETWNPIVKLTGHDTAPADRFGTSVSLSGEYALVGAPLADTEQPNSGAAYVFRHDGLTWIEQVKLVAGDRSFNDHFGISVSLLGDYAVIGADGGDGLVTNSGTAYIFKREGSSWNQVVELYASDGVEGQNYGFSVDLSGTDVVVGATGYGYSPYIDPAVYVYSGYAEALASVAVSIDSIYQSVPPQGATFPYNVTFTNNTADTLAIDFWTKLVRPDGSSVDPLLGPKTPVLGPHAVIDKSPIMSVPANRDPGDYLLIAYLGTYPDDVVDTDTTGFTKLASGLREEQATEATRLEGNHPNPFNPSTTFSYVLSEPGQVSLKVYNMLGQLVRTVVDQTQLEGHHEAVWDGRNETSGLVSSGIYIYRMTAGNFVETKRMLLLK